ncbi:MAG: pentapeptide repeat-containing protein [Candidatus Acidiferrales bacterium]
MASLFKFGFSRDRAANATATVEPGPAVELVAAAAPKRAEPPPPPPAPVDDAQLQEFLLKNFLTTETQPAETAAPEAAAPVHVHTASPSPAAPTPPQAAAPKAAPEAAPESVPEIATESMPEMPAESASQAAPQIAPEPQAAPKTETVSEPQPDPEPISNSITLADLHESQEVIAQAQLAAGSAPPAPPKVAPHEWALEETLANHKEWLESHAAVGAKADLRNAKLQDTELIGVNLRYADLQDANLKSSDLLLADLRDACLVRANLQEACLVGANLEGANLEGASLESAMGLLPRQLAGANLHEASLPAPILEFNALPGFARTSNTAARLFSTTLALSLLSCLAIWKTKDIQLLADSAIIPYLRSSAAAAAVPTDQIYLIAPAVLLVIYLWFLYNLQRVWDAALELPAIFPDGSVLGQKTPRIITGLLRTHFRWMNPDAPSTRVVEKAGSIVLAYWLVPLVLLFFWARYLTLQEIHGSFLQIALTLVAVGVAFYCTTSVGRPPEIWAAQGRPTKDYFARLKFLKPATLLASLFVVLLLISAGTVAGVPHDKARAPQFAAASVRRWVPSFLWALGYDPYAELTEASISRRPPNRNGADDQLLAVEGAHLNGTNFRYAQAYGIFLANAHLFRANFQGAFLSEADMRGADLGQANMKFAVLDRAQMNRANLDRAELDGANLARVDLRGANLSYSSLTDAVLVDARLDGASLYASHAENATLLRGNLEKADMREAHLDGANLESADLQQAFLWSTKLAGANLQKAQLATAIFIDADLRGADLRGAQFNGTVLNGANLQNANLDGADLRGALQLAASQVCSAKSRQGALLDATLQTQVDAQCGAPHQP